MNTSDIERHLRHAGVDLWGVADNEPQLPSAPALPRAVSIALRLQPAAIAGVKHGPTTSYLNEYRRVNLNLDQIAESLVALIRLAGHTAEGVRATIGDEDVDDWGTTDVFSHKSAATRAGLGWIGKTALFVSPEFGPKLRLTTVFTDLPLEPGTPVTIGRCGSCLACIKACPARAGRDVQWQAGMARDLLYDERACEHHLGSYERYAGICGICVAVCPLGQER